MCGDFGSSNYVKWKKKKVRSFERHPQKEKKNSSEPYRVVVVWSTRADVTRKHKYIDKKKATGEKEIKSPERKWCMGTKAPCDYVSHASSSRKMGHQFSSCPRDRKSVV